MATINGTALSDTLIGTESDDTIYGNAGNDKISGNTGNDSIFAGAGSDELYGGDGNDSLSGGAGDDQIYGGAGDDNINYTDDSGNDVIYAGDGDDLISFTSQSDSKTAFGENGNDRIYGGSGQDKIDGGLGNDQLEGGAGNDTLTGGDGDDKLYGEDGDDSLDGGAGVDYLNGGAGNDTLTGGDGNDSLSGGAGDDLIYGGAGNDNINYIDDSGNDVIYAGDGDDLVNYNTLTGTKIVFGESGNDKLIGGQSNDKIDGGLGTDQLEGGAGNDTLTGGDGDDKLYGEDGDDSLDGGAGVNYLYGGAGNDTLTGGDGDDKLYGEDGDDSLDGGAGVDYLNGGAGNDTLTGGDGNDSLSGGAGDDLIYGGAGNDNINYIDDSGNDVIYAGDGDDLVNYNTLTGTKIVFGESGNDKLIGGQSNDKIDGGLGNDQLEGGAGNDTLTGGDGDDKLYGEDGDDILDGGAGVNYLYGGAGNDTLTGGDGDDKLYGEDGDDSLDGGAGVDYLNGGAGNDTLTGGDGNDSLSGGAGDDLIYGGAGNDNINYIDDSGNDVIYAGDGDDLVNYNTLTGTKIVFGESGNDKLIGGQSNDKIDGGLGNDQLEGGAGNDTLTGGDGDDKLYGEDGDDSLDGGAGVDYLNGAAGNDTYHIRSTTQIVLDSGGVDSAMVYASFVKLPSTIENVYYLEGAQPLPYWISALLPDEAAGRYSNLFLDQYTYYFNFPSSIPSHQASDKEDSLGWSTFTAIQQARAITALDYISTIVGIRFEKTNDPLQANTITFANNDQADSAGYARFPSPSTGGSDVLLDNSNEPGNATISDGTYAAYVLIHELGHALGLKHPFAKPESDGDIADPPYLTTSEDRTVWTVMSYEDTSTDYFLKFSVLDIAALQYLYGPSKTSRTGDDIYSIATSEPNFIWDGLGVDTITAAACNQGCTIYLTPGYWGYAGASKSDYITAPGQITVNFGTVVENLIGSIYSDSLFGNEALNVIDGSAGNDLIKGLGGNDTLYGGDGNDELYGEAGDDYIDGGSGTDTAYFALALRDYSISYSAATGIYRISADISDGGVDSVVDVESFKFLDQSLTAQELRNLTLDSTAPTLVTASPADEATGVAIGSNVVLTFSEAIAKGTGTLVLKNSAGATIESFDVATSSAVTVSGTTLTVNPTSDLAYSTGYKLEIPSGAIKDSAGNSYIGTTAYNFTTTADSSVVLASIDERSTGTGNAASAYLDAPASISTTFALAIGQPNMARGLLDPGLVSDTDAYRLGTTNPGQYEITVKGSTWFANGDFSSSILPTLSLYDDSGQVVATSSTGSLQYTVSAKAVYFLYVTGAANQKSQYEVFFNLVSVGKAFDGDAGDNQIVGTEGSDSISAGGGSDVINAWGGDDTIDGGTGFDTAVWAGRAADFSVSFASGTWTILDNFWGLGSDTVKNVENLQFNDKSVIIQSETHGSYADLPPELYQFFIVAFNAAPGVTYMNQLAEAYRYGLSVKQIVDIYVTKSQFTDLYPTTLTNRELAVRLVDNIVKDSASAEVKAGAVQDIEAAMSIGYSRADVLFTVFGNLAKKPFTDPTWGNTAKFFANEIAVAKAYTEVMDQSTTDLETLRAALTAVTKDTSATTDAAAIELAIKGLFGTVPASAATPLSFASLPEEDDDVLPEPDPLSSYREDRGMMDLIEPYKPMSFDVLF